MDTEVREIHERVMVIDGHADIEIPGRESRYAGKDGRSRVTADKMRSGSVDSVVLAVADGWGPRNDPGYRASRARAERKLAALKAMVDAGEYVLARTAEEVERAKGQGTPSALLGFQNTQIVGKDIDALGYFHEAGCRVYALAHIGHNDCADSSRPNFSAETGEHEPVQEHGGLSDLGRQAVRHISKMGGLIDVCQLSRDATLQTLDIVERPVIASHSNVRALCNVSRNLSDDEIEGIAAGGGVVHVTPFRGYLFDTTNDALADAIVKARIDANLPEAYLYPFELYWEIKDADLQKSFLKSVSDLLGPGSLESLVDHVDYIVKRVGVNHVGIGTDFNHGGGMRGYQEAQDAPNVTAALIERGYSEADIDKIWGRNFLRALAGAQD